MICVHGNGEEGCYECGERIKVMREVKFRGRSRSDGTWLYGSYVQCEIDGDSIKDIYSLNDEFVDSETVSQYTGLLDCNDVEIYGGDKVRMLVDGDEIVSYVFWDCGGFCVEAWDDYCPYIGEYYDKRNIEVIGDLECNQMT